MQRVEKPTKVLIIGGGLAGMEAARVSAIRGCQVTLYEKGEKLGGHLIAASVPEFKQDVKRLLDWYTTQVEMLGVKIKLKVEATPELVKEEKADKVIIATGSTPIVPDIPGIDKPIVSTCIDLLTGKRKAGKSVVVIGGGLVGCETALWLTSEGKRVTIVEVLPELATGIFKANRAMLLDMLAANKVEAMTDTCVEEITADGVNVMDRNSRRKTIMCDTVALAAGLKPNRELYEFLRGDVPEIYIVGDCKEPRKIRHAIWDAFHVAYRLELVNEKPTRNL